MNIRGCLSRFSSSRNSRYLTRGFLSVFRYPLISSYSSLQLPVPACTGRFRHCCIFILSLRLSASPAAPNIPEDPRAADDVRDEMRLFTGKSRKSRHFLEIPPVVCGPVPVLPEFQRLFPVRERDLKTDDGTGLFLRGEHIAFRDRLCERYFRVINRRKWWQKYLFYLFYVYLRIL